MTKYIVMFTLLITSFTYGTAQQNNHNTKPLAQQIEALIKAQNYDKAEHLLKTYQTKLAKVDHLILRAQVDSFLYRARQSNQKIAHLLTNHAKEIAPAVKQKLLSLRSKNNEQLSHSQSISESANEIIDEHPRPLLLVPKKVNWFVKNCRYFGSLPKRTACAALHK